jgi:hypothetical protein
VVTVFLSSAEAALQSHGVTEDTERRLDFFFAASGREAADELARFLADETDYDVHATDDSVSGTTQPTTISPEIARRADRVLVTPSQAGGSAERPKATRPAGLDARFAGGARRTLLGSRLRSC